MWQFADRVAECVSDVTLGTVIVLVHVQPLALREANDRKLALQMSTSTAGSRGPNQSFSGLQGGYAVREPRASCRGRAAAGGPIAPSCA